MQEKSTGRKPARRQSAVGEEEKASFTLRLFPELLREIDAVLASIPVRRRPSRNDYSTQAIEEKSNSPVQKRFDEDSLL